MHPTWQRTRPELPDDKHCGWAFASEGDPPLSNSAGHGSFDCSGCIPDTVNGAKSVRDLYDLAGGKPGGLTSTCIFAPKIALHVAFPWVQGSTLYFLSLSGTRYTVPVLWCKKLKVIVNNESSEIIRMLNSSFNSLASNPDLDLYPEDLRPEIDQINEWVYHGGDVR